MAAKLREKDGFYWVVVHHQGRRKWKKIGKDKREAQKVVHKVNAQLARRDVLDGAEAEGSDDRGGAPSLVRGLQADVLALLRRSSRR